MGVFLLPSAWIWSQISDSKYLLCIQGWGALERRNKIYRGSLHFFRVTKLLFTRKERKGQKIKLPCFPFAGSPAQWHSYLRDFSAKFRQPIFDEIDSNSNLPNLFGPFQKHQVTTFTSHWVPSSATESPNSRCRGTTGLIYMHWAKISMLHQNYSSSSPSSSLASESTSSLSSGRWCDTLFVLE